jgi:hypothetical protein
MPVEQAMPRSIDNAHSAVADFLQNFIPQGYECPVCIR